MLAAQVLGLGLGATDAAAADTGHPPHHPGRTLGTVGTALRAGPDGGGPPLGGTVDGAVGGALDGLAPDGGADTAGTVETVGTAGTRPGQGLGGVLDQHLDQQLDQHLQQQLGAGELPLPGHHADRPDAFSLAAGLLSAVPPQPRAEDGARASRSGPEGGRDTGGTRPNSPAESPRAPEATVPVQRAAATPLPAAAPAATPAGSSRPAAPRPAPADAPPPTAAAPDRLTLTAAPTRPAGEGAVAVLIPIAAGLLLTAAAMYKHRGLPGGH
ncbi:MULTISPECIES: hypothetical protein [Kitasatospora]|uniref:hypothetical protein n=1 Tax=Kitasatospora TaxID=2063 RepID=UPI0003059402|nr:MULTISPECIES: hypothetical protein [Kitasatospora]